MTYHNTTHLQGDDLAQEIHNAEKQEAAVLALFRNRNRPMSPSMVHREIEKFGKRWPITSVRRAMTNLANEGSLTKTDLQVVGIYSKKEHCWRLPELQGELFQ